MYPYRPCIISPENAASDDYRKLSLSLIQDETVIISILEGESSSNFEIKLKNLECVIRALKIVGQFDG